MTGVYAPVASIFSKEGDLEVNQTLENMKKILKQTPKMSGFVILGSTGEYPSMASSEKIKLLESVSKEFASSSDQVLIAGTGCGGTKETIEMTKRAADLGYDAAMVVTPYYFKGQMSDAAINHHFETVASASSIPIILYNVPKFTSFDISVKSIETLSKHPNIIGIKESSGSTSKMASCIRFGNQLGPKEGCFFPFAGAVADFLPALSVGAKGGVMALANVIASELVHVHQLWLQRDFEKAAKFHGNLLSLSDAFGKLGVPALKAAMDLSGLYGGQPRSPLLPLSAAERENIKQLLQAVKDAKK
eukprot:TRINITY_DN12703_c0_g1_i1.p1 TRINITY_DN12703_c0_g1~~TRINITY_DN12703_c0_g1_i1.p1  ORF type:complete len:346 (-),score=99.30 TRINITY_DN12703_c0_g1_i1:11-922(-)